MKTEYTIRLLTMDDAAEAAKLWSLVFGDEESVVLAFFRLFAHQKGFGACAEADGNIVAAAYCPRETDYIAPDGSVHRGVYLYAVATHPEHRKQKLAQRVCNLLKDTAREQGTDFLFTRPSEDSLYPWYEEHIGAVPVLGGEQLEFERTEAVALPCAPLTAEEYGKQRTQHLAGLPHVRHSSRWMEWESVLHSAYGGGCVQIAGHIADYYSDAHSGMLQVNELLPHPTREQAQSLCAALMTYTGTSRCSCMVHGSGRYVSAAAKSGVLPEDNPWFGVCYG